MKMNENNLSFLIEKWGPYIIARGSEFMLPSPMAIAFAEDLTKTEEIILGCDGWRYVDRSKDGIVQVLEVELSIEDYIAWDNMTPAKNLEVIRTFLKSLPQNVDLISFQMNDPEASDKLIQAASSGS